MKISIIMASYNYAEYIKAAIDSVLNQTYKDWELIIVDDGSKDNSVEVIKEYIEKHVNIYLYQHENGINKGLSKTLQLGLSKAAGDYIAFLESDDYWTENHLQEKFEVLQNNPDIKFIFNQINYFSDDASLIPDIKNSDDSQKNYFRNISANLLKVNAIPTFSCVLVNSELLRNCDFDTPIDAYLDWWLWMQAACKSNIYYLHKKLTYWRIHQNSYIQNIKDDNLLKKREFYQKLYGFFINANKTKSIKEKFIYRFFVFVKLMELTPRMNKLFRNQLRWLDVLMYKEVLKA